MDSKKGKKYTQKTIPDSHISAGERSGAMKANANAELAEDETPISVATLRAEFQAYGDTIMNGIKTQIENMQKGIHSDISSLRMETKADIKALHDELSVKVEMLFNMHTEMSNTHKVMENSLSDASDRLITLEKRYDSLIKEHKKLQDKCTDLESRSRRQNLRIIGIAEGAENNNPTHFVTKFLVEVLGKENFGSPIVIDRAHRSLAPKPRNGERPRAMIIRLHYYSDKEKILKLSRDKGRLVYDGSPVHIFPDMSPEVGRQRAAFNSVKTRLRSAGIPYSLFFPAKLVVTMNGSRHAFTDPHEAEKYIQTNAPTPPKDGTD